MNGHAAMLVERWARYLGANATRRAAVVALGAAALGATEPAAAAGDEVCKAADPRDFVSRQSCEKLSCGTASGCVCAQTVGHKPACIRGFNPDNPRCPSRDQCSSKRPCGGGMVCAKTQVCCGRAVRACLNRCSA